MTEDRTKNWHYHLLQMVPTGKASEAGTGISYIHGAEWMAYDRNRPCWSTMMTITSTMTNKYHATAPSNCRLTSLRSNVLRTLNLYFQIECIRHSSTSICLRSVRTFTPSIVPIIPSNFAIISQPLKMDLLPFT
jgi:hypothetical protein